MNALQKARDNEARRNDEKKSRPKTPPAEEDGEFPRTNLLSGCRWIMQEGEVTMREMVID